jgi:hypothetical protein
MQFKCLSCEDKRWVCEDHPHQPWDEADGCALCGGAGAACRLCNTGSPPDDVLTLHGKQVIDQPVEWREAQLAKLLTPAPPSILYVGHGSADMGVQLLERAKQLQLEGPVAKRLGSPYGPGVRSPWQNVKVQGSVPPERFRR